MTIKTRALAHQMYVGMGAVFMGIIAFLNIGCSTPYGKEALREPRPTATNSYSVPEAHDVGNRNAKTLPTEGIKSITKLAGWIRIDIGTSKIKISRRSLAEKPSIFVSTLIPKDSTVLALDCESRNQQPRIEQRCTEFPFGATYEVREVTIQDFRDRPFCYVVTAAKMIDGAPGGLHSFVFSDQDGDGILETFSLMNTSSCETPTWVEARL